VVGCQILLGCRGGVEVSMGDGDELLGSVLSLIDLDLNVKYLAGNFCYWISLESNERLNCYLSFQDVVVILGRGLREWCLQF
jgi:hypothetical protein